MGVDWAMECCGEDLCNDPTSQFPECFVSSLNYVLDSEDTWCDTVVNDDGRVLQQYRENDPFVYDVGHAWGVCSSKPRLPSFGMDYDPTD